MLQIADLQNYNESNIKELINVVEPILSKRIALHKKYSRNADETNVMFSNDNKKTSLPYEKFITDLATGYLSGTPTYRVNVTNDEGTYKILEKLLDVKRKDTSYQLEMETLIKYISNYNDDQQELHDLIHDCLELTSCYELVYENENNEIVYASLSPLQTVATWDYATPPNLTGIIRKWDEKALNGNTVTKIELIDKNFIRRYSNNGEFTSLEAIEEHYWSDVPAFAVETPFSIFEPCEDVISAIEQLIQNIRNTYQYNDQDCKLKIVGFQPQNEVLTVDDEGNAVLNQARILEDNAILNAKTFYIPDQGDVSYITKPLDSNGAIEMFKMYIDLMFQLSGIPNTSDLAFDSTDLNASAIDRKFYIMNMCTEKIVSMLKKALLRRWELIFNRINLKKGSNYDFRNIEVDIPKDLPSNQSEMADFYLKLKDLISEQTITESLGFNYSSEKEKKENEASDNMQTNLERIKRVNSLNEQQGNNQEEMEGDGPGTKKAPADN